MDNSRIPFNPEPIILSHEEFEALLDLINRPPREPTLTMIEAVKRFKEMCKD
jgi:uncharacterized protein (DUF1778 family)